MMALGEIRTHGKAQGNPTPKGFPFRVTKIAQSLQVVNQTFPQIIIVPADIIQVA
jgi:hypothetical protein